MQGLFGNAGVTGQLLSSLVVYAVVIGGLYLFLFRPQQKRRKQEEEMRKSVSIGDEITTIGGIVGKVVSVKNDSDSLIIETASEKLKIKKWAIATVENQK